METGGTRGKSDQQGLGGPGGSRRDPVASLGEWAPTALCVLFGPPHHPVSSVKVKVEFNYSTIASTIQLLAFHYQCFPKHFTKGFSSVRSSNLVLILINY